MRRSAIAVPKQTSWGSDRFQGTRTQAGHQVIVMLTCWMCSSKTARRVLLLRMGSTPSLMKLMEVAANMPKEVLLPSGSLKETSHLDISCCLESMQCSHDWLLKPNNNDPSSPSRSYHISSILLSIPAKPEIGHLRPEYFHVIQLPSRDDFTFLHSTWILLMPESIPDIAHSRLCKYCGSSNFPIRPLTL